MNEIILIIVNAICTIAFICFIQSECKSRKVRIRYNELLVEQNDLLNKILKQGCEADEN